MEQHDFDIIVLDMNYKAGENSGNEGLYWLRRILKTDPSMVVILITAYADIELAVTGIKDGATDFIVKPWENQKLLTTLKAALQLRESRRELDVLKQKQQVMREEMDRQFKKYEGKSPVMKEIHDTILKVAKTDASVLITGENGTGKEIIAREIHNLSRRSHEVFISVDLGSLSETLFESEIFGHTKGAFTDAKENRNGRFENASGGTLFLDEIGNLPVSMQSKLLQALETHKIIRVGSNRPVPVDIRLISATNKNLDDMVDRELFRKDLLYRINTVHIEIPPLRERQEDILPLAEFFLHDFTQKYEKPDARFNMSALDVLLQYDWPGNIRELKHTIEKGIILSDGKVIRGEDLGLNKSKFQRENVSFDIGLDEAEKRVILAALSRYKWNISDVSKNLHIGRQTLYRKIKKYGL
jgi:DNA-binding NtrC family response regulator